jgi:hypothetical protein
VKEIDFLPEWYKSGRKREISFRTQVIGLGGVLIIMIVWNFVTAHSISKARAVIGQNKPTQAEAESVSLEFEKIKSEIAQWQKKLKSMEEMDSKIDVPGVLAEMSYLIDDGIVLSQVAFDAERFEDELVKDGLKASRQTNNVVRVAGGGLLGKEKQPLGNVRFRILIRGVAADPGNIAELICKLEESPYFCLVYPSFSRNRNIKAGPEKNVPVSEFEISCYLANYQEKQKS